MDAIAQLSTGDMLRAAVAAGTEVRRCTYQTYHSFTSRVPFLRRAHPKYCHRWASRPRRSWWPASSSVMVRTSRSQSLPAASPSICPLADQCFLPGAVHLAVVAYHDASSADVVIGIIKDRIAEPDCAHGFILDGMPRTAVQAEAINKVLAETGECVNSVVSLEVPDAVLGARHF